MTELTNVTFKVNGTEVSGEPIAMYCTMSYCMGKPKCSLPLFEVSSAEVPATMSLARFLRDRLHLTGTKISCGQGGCGACVVVAEFKDAADGATDVVRSVNSVRVRW